MHMGCRRQNTYKMQDVECLITRCRRQQLREDMGQQIGGP